MGIVVVGIAYASGILGELVPELIALSNPKRISAAVARPITWDACIGRPLVWLPTA